MVTYPCEQAAIPQLYLLLLPDMTTIARLRLAISMPKSMQSVNNSCIYTCSLYMPRVLFGFNCGLHDWNLAFVFDPTFEILSLQFG